MTYIPLKLDTKEYPQLPVMVLFESGSHKINIGAAYEVLGPQRSNTFSGFHDFTGCDQTSKFNWKLKATCWKTFLDGSEDALAVYTDLWVRDNVADTTLTIFDKCVVHLFNEFGDLTDATWSMYTRQLDFHNTPSTKAALKYKVS